MKDQLVSFEVAKLAKEKGFDDSANHYYEIDIISNYQLLEYPIIPHDHQLEIINTPTQSLLQKWLREKHEMHFIIKFVPETGNYNCEIRDGDIDLTLGHITTVLAKTYEAALEEGLKEALNLTKD